MGNAWCFGSPLKFVDPTPESEGNVALIASSTPRRECKTCGLDISDKPAHYYTCLECYKKQHPRVVSKSVRSCDKCGIDICNRPASHKVCLSCYRESTLINDKGRKCNKCKRDISDRPLSDNECLSCYNLTLVQKECSKCGKEFEVTRDESYKKMCSRSECVTLSDKQIAKVSETLGKKGYSSKAILWLEGIAKEQGIHIKHAKNGGEVTIRTDAGNKTVDGYSEDNKTVYEFHGNHYHGCSPTGPFPQDKLGVRGKTYAELYEATIKREKAIRDSGYKLVSIFEHEFEK